MKRRYDSLEYACEVEEAVQKIPDLCVGADVMVGFPSEGELEFKETLNLLASLPISYLHVFPFSERAGTPATRLSAKVSPEDKRRKCQYEHQEHREDLIPREVQSVNYKHHAF